MQQLLRTPLIAKQHYTVLFSLAIMIVALLVGWHYYQLPQALPYYASWDMELISSLDVLLINSHQLPSHFAHTAFGMYLIMKYALQIAYACHALSINALQQLPATLNPVLSIAEVTRFLRLLSPIILTSSLLLLWASLHLSFKPKKLLSFLMLLAIITSSSYFGISYIIRTELYAYFFWCLSVCCGCLALRSSRASSLWWLITGLMIGISFTTKVQSLFYLASLPFFWGMFYVVTPASPVTRPKYYLAFFNLFLLITLTYFAYRSPTFNVMTVRDGYSLFTLQHLALWLLILMSLSGFYWQKKLGSILTITHLLLCGFLLSYFLTLLLYPGNISLSLKHSFLMYKITMLGIVPQHFNQLMGISQFNNVIYNVLSIKWLYLSIVLLLVMIGLLQAKKIIARQPLILIFSLIIILIHLIFIYLAIRLGVQRDQCWLVSLPTLLLISLTLYLANSSLQNNHNLPRFAMAICVLIIAGHAITALKPQGVLGYYSEQAFSVGPYTGNQQQYTTIMRHMLNAPKNTVRLFQQAQHTQNLKHLFTTLFIWHPIMLSQASIAEPGMAITRQPTLETIQQLPQSLRGQLLINPFTGPRPLNLHQALLNLSSTISRYDYKIYVFININQLPSTWHDLLPQALNATTKKNHQLRHYRGILLDKPWVIRLLKHPQPFFLIIKQASLSVKPYPQKLLNLPYGRQVRVVN